MTKKIDARTIKEVLRSRYGGSQWKILFEVRLGTGWGKRREQRMDAWAMNMYQSRNHERVAFEIKVSAADFNRELRDPLKSRGARLLANRFYFVAPEGVINPERVPEHAGLIEVVPAEHVTTGFMLKTVVDAPWYDTDAPNWGFLANLLRWEAKEGPEE